MTPRRNPAPSVSLEVRSQLAVVYTSNAGPHPIINTRVRRERADKDPQQFSSSLWTTTFLSRHHIWARAHFVLFFFF